MSAFENGVTHERRKSQRKRTLLTGMVRELNKTGTFSCTVRNLCDDGARLDLGNSAWVADQFELDIASHDRREPVRVVWRRFDAVGVMFRPQDRRVGIRTQERVVYLEAERERLRRRVTDLTG
jgi:hypothetical protein